MIHIFIAATKGNLSLPNSRYFSILILIFICLTQIGCTHLLYPADRRVLIKKEMIVKQPSDLYIPIPNKDQSNFLHAWHFSAKNQKKNTLIVHFHGNGQNLTTHFLYFHWLAEHGYDYLIFDYRGYGASSDESATQEKTVLDGLALFEYTDEKFKNYDVVAIGQSLGSNVLLRTLQERNQQQKSLPKLVVLDSSFMSYQQAASSVLSQRWFLYPLKPLAYLLISDRWSASQNIKSTPSLPALFFHGTNDAIIQEKLGKENFEKWPGPKHYIPQINGQHTSAFTEVFSKNNKTLLINCIEIARLQAEKFSDCLKMPE